MEKDIEAMPSVKPTRVKSIEKIESESCVYDMQLEGESPYFFANGILVHNSVFFLAAPLIKHRYPDVDPTDSEKMTEKILEITKYVQDFINGSFDVFAKNVFNLDSHIFDLKQEVVARTGIWTGKKRYALWNINIGGVPVDELEIKGIDTVRTSFPFAFRDFLSEVLVSILKGKSEDEVSDYVLDFKSGLNDISLGNICIPMSVNGLRKYSAEGFLQFGKGAPAHVKAAIAYNHLLEHWGYSKKYEPIRESEKIFWVYLKKNEFGLDGIAFKNYEDPPKILEFIETYVDRQQIFDKQLTNKLESFYEALGWPMPSLASKKAKRFFK